jgi:hypothetical protein
LGEFPLKKTAFSHERSPKTPYFLGNPAHLQEFRQTGAIRVGERTFVPDTPYGV